jgi:hypothetical protein
MVKRSALVFPLNFSPNTLSIYFFTFPCILRISGYFKGSTLGSLVFAESIYALYSAGPEALTKLDWSIPFSSAYQLGAFV